MSTAHNEQPQVRGEIEYQTLARLSQQTKISTLHSLHLNRQSMSSSVAYIRRDKACEMRYDVLSSLRSTSLIEAEVQESITTVADNLLQHSISRRYNPMSLSQPWSDPVPSEDPPRELPPKGKSNEGPGMQGLALLACWRGLSGALL